MIRAELSYDGQNVFMVKEMPDGYPPTYFRLCQYAPMSDPSSWQDDGNITVEVKYTILVFQLDMDASYNRHYNKPENRYEREMAHHTGRSVPPLKTYLYKFSHTEQSRSSMEMDSFDEGFAEPTKDVNLDFLTNRLKGGDKAKKKILLNFLKRR